MSALDGRLTLEQVRRMQMTMPDLVDIARWLQPVIQAELTKGHHTYAVFPGEHGVRVAWDRGN